MAFERNNTAGDFETMLRRHLEHANQPGSSCGNFDAEVAGAYLEDALGRSARARYESHLAGCADCRHAVATLHRLALPEGVASAEMAQRATGLWERLREALGISGWRYGILATAGLLIVMIGVYAIKRQSATLSPAGTIAMADKTAIEQPVPAAVNANPVASVQSASGSQPPRSESRQEQRSARPRILSESQPAAAPVPPTSGLAQQVAGVRSLPQAENEVKTETAAPSAAQVVPSSQVAAKPRDADVRKGDQPGQRQDAPRPAESTAVQSAVSEPSRPLPDAAGRRLAPRESAAKAARPQPTPKPNEDENFHALTRKVRDKVFRFDRGVWIDQEYKPENRLQRTRLARGSAEYDRLLTEIPALSPFFDLGPVIVIWQGRVYEVRK